jgi:hypothetical protein
MACTSCATGRPNLLRIITETELAGMHCGNLQTLSAAVAGSQLDLFLRGQRLNMAKARRCHWLVHEWLIDWEYYGWSFIRCPHQWRKELTSVPIMVGACRENAVLLLIELVDTSHSRGVCRVGTPQHFLQPLMQAVDLGEPSTRKNARPRH